MAFRYSGKNWEGRNWRVAGSIITFGNQIMQLRGTTNSFATDGTVASKNHDQVSPGSDHRPKPTTGSGIVRAIDFHEHEAGAVDAVAEAIRDDRDPRCLYVIHDDRMFSSYPTSKHPAWTWRPYGGVNGHENHGHLSVVDDPIGEQTHPWAMPGVIIPKEDDVFNLLNISETLVRHAWEQGWYKRRDGSPDRSQVTLKYWLDNLAKLQEAVAPPGFEKDWLAWRRAVANGIALSAGVPGRDGKDGAPGKDGADGTTEARVVEIVESARIRVG